MWRIPEKGKGGLFTCLLGKQVLFCMERAVTLPERSQTVFHRTQGEAKLCWELIALGEKAGLQVVLVHRARAGPWSLLVPASACSLLRFQAVSSRD